MFHLYILSYDYFYQKNLSPRKAKLVSLNKSRSIKIKDWSKVKNEFIQEC